MPQGRSITKRLSRKDAGAFLKAVRRFGRVQRISDIASSVGAALQDQSSSARWVPPSPHSTADCCPSTGAKQMLKPVGGAGMRCGGASSTAARRWSGLRLRRRRIPKMHCWTGLVWA